MKYLLISLLFTVSAFANEDASSGLECVMIYKNSNNFSHTVLTSGGWLVAGGELVGEAVKMDGDGATASTTPANYIEISEKIMGLSDYWTVTVFNSEKVIIGIIDFPKVDVFAGESGSIKATFEVEAYEETGEDPIVFDTLEVVCRNTVFAG